jgi:glycerol uptake facilitator-like aquaporin
VKGNLIRETVAEFIGKFMLVFVGAGAVTVVSQGSSAGLVHGFFFRPATTKSID